jgi:replicative DNA helicase
MKAHRNGKPAREERPSEILDRLPPQDLDAERGVLGSLLILPELCDEVALILRAEDFYSDAHQTIYRRMQELHENGKPVDVVLLRAKFKHFNEFDNIGGDAYLSDLARAVPTAAHAEHYARIVHQKATLRRMIQASTDILRDAWDSSDEPRDLLSRAEERIFGIYEDRWASEATSAHDMLADALATIGDKTKQSKGGIKTGFHDFDSLTGGLHAGELVILASRPSIGKTALALNIADFVGTSGVGTLLVSLEMPRRDWSWRSACWRLGRSSRRGSFAAACSTRMTGKPSWKPRRRWRSRPCTSTTRHRGMSPRSRRWRDGTSGRPGLGSSSSITCN